jgi:hypothetical protein
MVLVRGECTNCVVPRLRVHAANYPALSQPVGGGAREGTRTHLANLLVCSGSWRLFRSKCALTSYMTNASRGKDPQLSLPGSVYVCQLIKLEGRLGTLGRECDYVCSKRHRSSEKTSATLSQSVIYLYFFLDGSFINE